MSTRRKVMIGIGAAVILGMHVVVAFSMGVYVGAHGWNWQGVSLAGPVSNQGGPGGQPGQQPPGQFPPGDGQALPGQLPPGGQSPPGGQFGSPDQGAQLPLGPPDLIGRIRTVEGTTLNLATEDGPRAVELTAETKIRTREGQEATVEDLSPGTPAAIFGHPGEGNQTLVADVLVLLPKQQNP